MKPSSAFRRAQKTPFSAASIMTATPLAPGVDLKHQKPHDQQSTAD